MKEEEDAIVIDDEPMVHEDPVTLGPTPTPGNTYFDVQLAICKQTNHQEDPEEKLIHRLSKFFQYNRQIEPGRQYFCPRRQPDASDNIDIIETQVIIHGLDFMKLKDVKKDYETKEAVRINPSNFKLIYPDRGTAWKALCKNSKMPLIDKLQSEESPFPKCWFQMKPYSINNRIVAVTARFATEKQRDIQPRQEEKYEIYRQCSQIYNDQEKRRRDEEATREALKRERLEINKQKNSNGLYERYERNAERGWQRGKNSNPGAHRQEQSRSRSRSRSKDREQKSRNDGDSMSNYSFVLGTLNKTMGGIQLRQSSVMEPERADMSLNLGPQNPVEEVHNWNGEGGKGSNLSVDWSYSKYMKQQQQMEENKARMKKYEIITIDDDN